MQQSPQIINPVQKQPGYKKVKPKKVQVTFSYTLIKRYDVNIWPRKINTNHDNT